MHDCDSRPEGAADARPVHPTPLGRRGALPLPGLALARGPAAAVDRTEHQRVIWEFENAYPLPPSSHYGATLAMTEEGPGEAFIAAPQAGAWARLLRDPTPLYNSWFTTTGAWNPAAPQAYAAAGHHTLLLRTDLVAGGTTRIVVVGGDPVVTGIVGDVAALDTNVYNTTVIAIGQPDYNAGAGSVRIYVLSADTGAFEVAATFLGGTGDRLGASIALKAGFVLAGAPGHGDNGAVHVFAQGAEWVEWQRIDSPSTTQVGEEFGAAIALDSGGGWLAIGGPLHDRFLPGGASQVDCGGVWIYRASGLLFQLDAFLRPDGIAAGDRFGASVALRGLGLGLGAVLVAGSPREDHQFGDSGAAYLFLRTATTWSERLRLIDSAPGAANNLGAKVALNGHDVLVSAPNATANGVFQQGQVLVYRDVVPLLADGFESGDVAAWSGAVP